MIRRTIIFFVRVIIRILDSLSPSLRHREMADAADRQFINDYIQSCMKYISRDAKILEFDGGVVYGIDITKEKGGIVKFATKKGRVGINHISYEWELEKDDLNNVNEKFDVIIATQLLGSFINPHDVLKKLKSLLIAGGCLIITVSGPSYPRVRGLVSFYSKEGLVKICNSCFPRAHIRNVKAYGDIYSAIGMMSYLTQKVGTEPIHLRDKEFAHDVICGAVCIK